MPTPRSRKQRVTELARLHLIWTTADKIVNTRDTDCRIGHADDTVLDALTITTRARNAFLRLTGYMPWDIKAHELHVLKPSKRIAQALTERTATGEPI